ncbi:MAG: hypothetical protein WC762_12705 [Methylobacter sp.]|jgi:hypothetical protein
MAHKKHFLFFLVTAHTALLLLGCEAVPRSVVAFTGTNIGLDISENPTTQMPHMKLGYNRAEGAFVSDKVFHEKNGQKESDDVANVLMELRYGDGNNINPSIYQRLAVGKTAVTQDGATALFLRSADGTIPTKEAVDNAKNAIKALSPEKLQPIK